MKFETDRTWAGFVYVAFAIDCFSRAVVGWHAATAKDTAMVTTTLRMTPWRGDQTGHPVGAGLIHHSDVGRQGGFSRSSQHCAVRAECTCSANTFARLFQPWSFRG
ncbi:DDE-type integrase/transposase/recombinase [Rhodococcus jostii]|uniref:DDE-type integrase/transposase/recombinase n=1 Tax=Rhodococcus jostii TaxID=132919 RepID=UPI0036537B37